MLLQFTIFSSEGISGGSQSSVAGDSRLPFPAAFQTHLRSGTEGRRDLKNVQSNYHSRVFNNITYQLKTFKKRCVLVTL